MTRQTFSDLTSLALDLRKQLTDTEFEDKKKYILIYAYNGTGKTRLSGEFKNLGKVEDLSDTLYFNAFTEDLFYWDNDLEYDQNRILKFNKESKFFYGLENFSLEEKIYFHPKRYADYNFKIDYTEGSVSFWRDGLSVEGDEDRSNNIKISRGEENIFIWCFFLAIAELAINQEEGYQWVKYLYIDDPISSLDENNAIQVANQLAQMLKRQQHPLKVVISSHHGLFFNVLVNEFSGKNRRAIFLTRNRDSSEYVITNTGDTPFFQHIANLVELKKAVEEGKIYTYHFNILRNILEKTASFHGADGFRYCLRDGEDETEKSMYSRFIGIMNHGNYSIYDVSLIMPEYVSHFEKLFRTFMEDYNFDLSGFERIVQ